MLPRLPVVVAVVAALAQAGTAQEPAPQQPAAQQPAASQQPTPPPATATPQQPTFRTGINFVRVDVIVSDKKGTPVPDLKATDFEVLEDGKPQAIEQFKFIKIDGNPQPGEPPARQIRSLEDEQAEAARDDVRLFVIFFDDYHTRMGGALAVKEPLIKFIQQHLGPNDMIAVMYPLTPLDAVVLSRNHKAVIGAINQFQGRKFNYIPRNQFEEQYANYPTEVVEQIRNQVTMTALRGLSTRLGALREGRKAIIFVSEGFTSLLPQQMRNPIATMPGVGNPRSRDPFAGENDLNEDRARMLTDAELLTHMREVWDAANRNNTAIYSLDPRGMAAFEYGIEEGVGLKVDSRGLQASQDTLRVLSNETDGRAIVNQNDLDKGLRQMVRDSSAYYLIGYNSSQAPNDGKFHEIKVRLKRSGLDVRARRGYWAPTLEDTARLTTPKPETPKPVQQALASLAAPGGRSGAGSRAIRTWIGTSRADNGKTRVTFIWEPAPPPPGAVQRDQPGRVSLIAARAGGELVWRGRVPEAGLASAAPTAAPGAPPAAGPQSVTFEAPPGKIELRISVEQSGSGGVIDSEIRDVTVPDLTAPDGMSTPRVFRSRTAREFQMAVRDPDAVPTAGREFSRTERLLIRFDVYGTDAPKAAILNRTGQKMVDVPIAPAAAGGTHQIDLGLGSIAPGEYLIELTAAGAKELIPLRVTS
jgi:VWFA-related protein